MNKYLKHPIIRTVNYMLRHEFPECTVSFKDDYDGNAIIVVTMSEETRKKYKLAEAIREFPIINNRITGTKRINPFEFDQMIQKIEDLETNMEINKQKKISENTRRTLHAAEEFIANEPLFIKENDAYKIISFKLNEIQRFYKLIYTEKISHLEKLSDDQDMSNAKQFKMADLTENIQASILHTAFPGLVVPAVEYLAGIREGKENWLDAEDAYVKIPHTKIYQMFHVRPLDVLYDSFDIIQVGKYAENPVRRLVLLNDTDIVYRITKDWVGNESVETTSYQDYLIDRNSIINDYKRDIMSIYNETGTIPAVIIDEINIAEDPTNGYILMDKPDAIKKIKEKKLKNPIFDIEKKINKLIERKKYHKYVIIKLKKDKNDPKYITLSINEFGKSIKAKIDLVKAEIEDPYIGNLLSITNHSDQKEKVSQSKYKITWELVELIRNELARLKNTDEYKCGILTILLAENGIELEDISSDNVFVCIYNMGSTKLYFDPYKKVMKIGDKDLSESDMKLLSKVKEAFQIVYK